MKKKTTLSTGAVLIVIVIGVLGMILRNNHVSPPESVDLSGLPKTAKTFSTAKKRLYKKIYYDHRESIYCGCSYSEKRKVNHRSCGYKARGDAKRAKRIEAEHIVPASWIGKGRSCWTDTNCKVKGKKLKGRECCIATDAVFRTAHNDLQNLAPAVGDANAARSDRLYGIVSGEPRDFGKCDFEVDFDTDLAEPSPKVQGDVARVTLYMAQTYGVNLSPQQRKMFDAWNREDPPSEWEKERNRRIAEIQGKGNPFVENR